MTKEIYLHVTFQSTLPRRERLFVAWMPAGSRCFNPRSREGSDIQVYCLSCLCSCFNPRSREGSDSEQIELSQDSQLFQSTLPRRERQQHVIFDGC